MSKKQWLVLVMTSLGESYFEAGFNTRKEAEDLLEVMISSRDEVLKNNEPSSFAENSYPYFTVLEVEAIEDNPVYHTYYSAKLETRNTSNTRKYLATIECHTVRESVMRENPSLYAGFQYLMENPKHPVLLGKTVSEDGNLIVEKYITLEPLNLPFVGNTKVVYLPSH